MDSNPEQTIRLSNGETEMLTRALLEARDQAEVPSAGGTETQFIRRSNQGAKSKAGSNQQVSHDSGNMIF